MTPDIRRASVTAVALLMALVWNDSAHAQNNPRDYQMVTHSETTLVAARLKEEGIDGRWIALEMRIFNILAGKKLRINSQGIFSVDCSSNGVEQIRSQYNLEVNPDKPPLWRLAPVDPKYENGFFARDIKYREISVFLATQRKAMLAGADEETQKKLSSPGFFPEPLEVSVAFACAVLKDKLSVADAAELMMTTGGLSDIKTLNCVMHSTDSAEAKPLNMQVRFSEAKRSVQVQGEWKKSRSIDPQFITANHYGLELSVNRSTGRAVGVTQREGIDLSWEGPCDIFDAARRKF